ncbi:tail completion protein [Synechococcus phage S-N03]|uniref:Tail completion protein n=1 Tax=Synechococcus phage S-N03 TaxID=2718943 RepID=A0A6G8R646_9CAUD|nr:tail tube [Synechococcus phage S-N03]QIN96851.1 tail completion protein [Synechococcus phage S-N03]
MALTSNNDTLVPELKYTGIENRNFLSPVGFKFSIEKMRGVDFFCQAANVPGITMEKVQQPTRFNKIPQPGDELYYEDLTIRFLVDENLKNFYQVHDWLRNLATPYSSKEFTMKRGQLESQNPNTKPGADSANNQWRSDCSLFILSNNYQPVAEFVFKDAFPISLTTLQFDSTSEDTNYFTAECKLAYSRYDYFIHQAAQATDASMEPNFLTSEQGVVLPLS